MNPLTTRFLSDPSLIADLAAVWDDFPREAEQFGDGLDGTNCFAWFEAIKEAFSVAANVCVVQVCRAERSMGLLPVVRPTGRGWGLKLLAPTELYGGRCGPLLRNPKDVEAAVALLAQLARSMRGWTHLEITTPEGVPAHTLRGACAGLGWRYIEEPLPASAGFTIPGADEDLLQSLPARFRQNLRTAQNRANKIGARLHFDLIEDPEQSADLMDNILQIDAGSWKHAAGSAITNHPQQEAFYRSLVRRALRDRLLLAMLIRLDGQAIGYNFGLLRDGVFCCLKHSHLQAHDGLSPSNLLMVALLKKLAERGATRFDWMGVVEPHKLRWSQHFEFYERRHFRVFQASLMGRAHFALVRLRAWLRKPKSGVADPCNDSGVAPKNGSE